MAWLESSANGKRHRSGYRVDGKTLHTPWVGLKREARAAGNDAEAAVRAGTWKDPSAGKITFSAYFEEWLPNRVIEDNTVAHYRGCYNASLRDKFGTMELRQITTGVVQRWVAGMVKAGVTARTIESRFKALQTVLAAQKGVSALRDGLISTNPCQGITLPPRDKREVDVYSVDECDTVVAGLDAWWRPLPLFASATGMRWGELMGLKVSDFGDHFTSVVVQRTITQITVESTGNGTPFKYKDRPKGKKPRTIGLDPEAAELIRTLVKERRLFPGDRVFSMPGKDGLPLRTTEWPEGMPISRSFHRQSIWLPVHKATGVKVRRMHDLRGSHISWLLAGGADVTSVMHRVGHTQLSTTQVYVDAMPDADQRALDALAETRRRSRALRSSTS